MTEVVLSQGVAAEHWPDAELAEIVRLAGAANLTAWIEHLREAKTPSGGTGNGWKRCGIAPRPRVCPGCGGPVVGRADAVYCGSTCRVRAHRARSQPHAGTTG
jgi:hypothetical protein